MEKIIVTTEKEYFVSIDGKKFETEEECIQYEKMHELIKKYIEESKEAANLSQVYMSYFAIKDSIMDDGYICLRYNKNEHNDFYKTIQTFIINKIKEFAELTKSSILEIRNFEKDYKDGELLFLYFYYDVDMFGIAEKINIILLSRDEIYDLLKKEQDKIISLMQKINI